MYKSKLVEWILPIRYYSKQRVLPYRLSLLYWRK